MKSENKETQRREDGSNQRTGRNGKIFRRQGSPTTINSKEDGSATAPTKINSKENGSPPAHRDCHGRNTGCGGSNGSCIGK